MRERWRKRRDPKSEEEEEKKKGEEGDPHPFALMFIHGALPQTGSQHCCPPPKWLLVGAEQPTACRRA